MNIDNSDQVINSTDIIERIENLESYLDDDECLAEMCHDEIQEYHRELDILRKVAKEGEGSPDWIYGETLIRESYFTDYIMELINDCYDLEQYNSGEWPYRHMSIDYEAAADEAKADYLDIDYDGVTYLIRVI